MADIRIEPGAAKVLSGLLCAGYGAYAVGGCVRDALLGKTPSDWDICTGALPQQTIALFGEENCIPTGIKHGTVTVKMDGGLYEVTTFRTEGTYSDGRHPDSVHFVPDVREDLARRDFTINAMAYNEREGLIDPFGGREDLLKNRVVRAVGEPMGRFTEDALRIMRLFRFASRFCFAIDEETGRAALALRERLSCVSGERLREELMKLLETEKPAAYLPVGIVRELMPQLREVPLQESEAALAATDALPPDAELRLAALLAPACSAANVAAAREAMKDLRCSNRTQGRVLRAIAGALNDYSGDAPRLRARMRRRLGEWGMEAFEDAALLAKAIRSAADARAVCAVVQMAREAKAKGLCCSVRELAVGGGDVMRALGGGAGPKIGETLERLLDAVLADELPNEREALLAAAKAMANDGKDHP